VNHAGNYKCAARHTGSANHVPVQACLLTHSHTAAAHRRGSIFPRQQPLAGLLQAARRRTAEERPAGGTTTPGSQPSSATPAHCAGLSEQQAAALPEIRAALELQELQASQDAGIFRHTRWVWGWGCG
jgi:hypothetical protein